jgi:hypothetical protein
MKVGSVCTKQYSCLPTWLSGESAILIKIVNRSTMPCIAIVEKVRNCPSPEPGTNKSNVVIKYYSNKVCLSPIFPYS